MATGGHGVVFSMGNPLVEIASVEEIDFPRLKKLISRFYQHDAVFEQAVATGAYSVDNFKMTLAWDLLLPSHQAILTAFESTAAQAMQFAAPDGETLSGSGHITEVGRVSKSEDHYQCEVVVEPTGEWT
jgi:hypothetical protein